MSTTNAAESIDHGVDALDDDPGPAEPSADDLINDVVDGLPDELAPPPAATPVYSQVDLNALRRLDMLKQRKRDAKALTTAIQKQIDQLEAELVEQMTLAGQVDGLPFDTRKATVRTDTWPKWADVDDDGNTDPDLDARYAAFRAAGPEWAALIKETVNSQTLRSFLLEIEEASLADGGPPLPECLPDAVRDVLTTVDQFSITFSNAKPSRASSRRAPRS